MKNHAKRMTFILPILGILMLIANHVDAIDNDDARKRNESVDTIVLHAIGGPYCKDGEVVFSGSSGNAEKWKVFFEREKGISIHHVVDRDGNIASSVDENRVAWHAKGRNARSIGIELTNKGDGLQEYPMVQIIALSKLVREIMSRHPDISNAKIIRHSDIDVRTFECGGKDVKTKQDPGPMFPYDSFIKSLSR